MKAIVYIEHEPVLQLKEEKSRDNDSLIEVQAASWSLRGTDDK